MSVFCIDIGNTHITYGLLRDGARISGGKQPTRSAESPLVLQEQLRSLLKNSDFDGISYCSVVPRATAAIIGPLEPILREKRSFHLHHRRNLGIRISYPEPGEIGQDRLANAVAAHRLFGAPCIVIDSGTAVTFDIVSANGGYEGGIIAPGLALMREYFHEKTAQLPLIDESIEVNSAIGRSTVQAMRIGSVYGFEGMISHLLEKVIGELQSKNEKSPAIIATGGDYQIIQRASSNRAVPKPDLTLQGLELAFYLNR